MLGVFFVLWIKLILFYIGAMLSSISIGGAIATANNSKLNPNKDEYKKIKKLYRIMLLAGIAIICVAIAVCIIK